MLAAGVDTQNRPL